MCSSSCSHHPASRFSIVAVLFALAVKIGCVVWLRHVWGGNFGIPSFDIVTIPNTDSRVWDIGPLQPVTLPFGNTVHYQLAGPAADAEWAALVPNGGTVHLGKDSRPYTLSMFHQLRCLDVVRYGLQTTYGINNSDSKPPIELTNHCINYLRQMALCRASTALEFIGVTPKPWLDFSVPADRPYTTCRDWRTVYAALDDNQREYRRRLSSN